MGVTLSKAAWWAAMKREHEVLAVVYDEEASFGKPQAFTPAERKLCLGLSSACAWFGVWAKYFYFSKVHIEDVVAFPSSFLAGIIDSKLCALGASALDFAMGKAPVRKVLRSDWDSQGGVKGRKSQFASLWAGVFTVGAGLHLARTAWKEPAEVQFKLFGKCASTLLMKWLVSEPLVITLKYLKDAFTGCVE
eukprot:TRINITY_DN29751_c0_g1_i1.p1 TRINITY_DN29751_c0_g1~~TRINITY_DN29751_c0_g1_i1.p1  ORF type:complete len:192 (+),score=36.26 TRINITY_DN29751_c0_g1_i1:182-757(+)